MKNCRSFHNVKYSKLLYSAYVKAKIEYISVVWNSYYAVDTVNIEKIQRKFLKSLSFKVAVRTL